MKRFICHHHVFADTCSVCRDKLTAMAHAEDRERDLAGLRIELVLFGVSAILTREQAEELRSTLDVYLNSDPAPELETLSQSFRVRTARRRSRNL